jgi:hypothetical protein
MAIILFPKLSGALLSATLESAMPPARAQGGTFDSKRNSYIGRIDQDV